MGNSNDVVFCSQVKSRLQSQSKGTDASLRYDGAIDALQRIAKEEGLSAFYRGFGTKATQTVFAAALMFAAKEEIAKAVHVSLFLCSYAQLD